MCGKILVHTPSEVRHQGITTNTQTRTRTQTCTRTRTCTCTYTHTHTHTHTQAPITTYIWTWKFQNLHIYIHKYIQITRCIRIHMYIQDINMCIQITTVYKSQLWPLNSVIASFLFAHRRAKALVTTLIQIITRIHTYTSIHIYKHMASHLRIWPLFCLVLCIYCARIQERDMRWLRLVGSLKS